MSVTWIVVSDSAKAEIFQVDKLEGPMNKIKELSHPESQARKQDLETGRRGRVFDSGGPGRHAMDPGVGPKDHEADRFAREVSEAIEDGRNNGGFDRLIIAAPPDFLGRLRKAISSAAGQLVVETLDKNLVGKDAEEIRERLETYV